MADESTIARPYAKALFAVAIEENQLQSWASVLELCVQVLRPLTDYLFDPRVGQRKVVELLLEAVADLSETQQNFLKLLAEKKRLAFLPAMLQAFLQMKAAHEKVLEVDIVTAYPLSDLQKEHFQERLSLRWQKRVMLNPILDPSIIGGVMIRAGDQVIDGSMRGRLNRLHRSLVSSL